MTELEERNFEKTNEILWEIDSLKGLAKCLRMQGTEASELSYDHLLYVFESCLGSIRDEVQDMLNGCEKAFMEEARS